MSIFIGLVYESRSGFDLIVPDASGCTASVKNIGDIPQAGKEALRLWAEAEISAGRSEPEPRGLDEVTSDPDVRREIADGAILLAVPLLLDSGRVRRINITLDAGLVEAIDTEAGDRGLTRSGFIASAARDKLMQ